jgi:hypothetical protein
MENLEKYFYNDAINWAHSSVFCPSHTTSENVLIKAFEK